MTASQPQIPDEISMAQLQQMAEAAAESDPTPETNDISEMSRERLEEIADKYVGEALNECDDPVIHKLMMLRILSNMIEWHTRVGNAQFEADENKSGVAWLRDAGKFQAMMTLLCDVNLGPYDYVTPIEE